MRNKKLNKRNERYLPLSDIEKIDDAFLNEIERVKMRLSGVSDKDLINTFYTVLMKAYSAEIELQTLEREVDYDIKFAEISERRRNLKPWRRCWLWRLIFQPLTNRAQDIIEKSEQLKADELHSEQERQNIKLKKQIEAARQLKDIIKAADKQEPATVFNTAPTQNESVNEVLNEEKSIAVTKSEQELPSVQLSLVDLPRPRPPRSCRKPPTPKQ